MSTGRKIVILKKGKLTKCSKYLHNWKERFVVLTDERLLTFDKEVLNSDCTLDLFLRDITEFDCSDPNNENEFTFHCEGKIYRFKAENKAILEEWSKSIDDAIKQSTANRSSNA